MTKSATVATLPDTKIHTRALLVWLNICTWTARKYDRKVSDKVNAEYAASRDAGRYNKFLLPGDADAYHTLITVSSSVRHAHYGKTLAWSDEGWRLLPTAAYMEYQTWFREQQRSFRSALDEFCAHYPTMQRNARNLLNGMYRDEDYPSIADIRKRFDLSLQFQPLPNFGDIRVDLADDQIAQIEADIQARITDAVGIAVSDAWSRLHDVVSRIQERLSSPDAIFRNSLIGNAIDVCNVLKTLNVTNDPNLEAMRARVEQSLTAYTPDQLRDEPQLRKRVASKAESIMSAMSAFYAPEDK